MLALLKTLFTVISCTFLCSLISAQEQYMFKHLETKDGLSHSRINDICKDSQGFMWFATAGGGLNRFDGYNYKVFRKIERDSLSLLDNYIYSVDEDANKNLWVNTGAGYVIYNPDKENFNRDVTRVLQQYDIPGEPSLIRIDKSKNIWVYVLGKGVYQYQPKTQKTIHYNIQNGSNLTDIEVGENDACLLYNSGEIDLVNKDSAEIIKSIKYLSQNDPMISDKYSMFIDKDGDWWVYSQEATGVWFYSHHTNQWTLYKSQHKIHGYSLSSDVVQDIKQDSRGKIWLGTDHGGIDIINKTNNTITNLQNDISDPRSLSNNSINKLFCDDMGIMWVGSYKRGISYYNDAIYKFRVEHFPEFRNLKNFDSDITCISEDKNGILWLGTNGSGLISYNRETGEKKRFQHQANNPNSISGDVIVCLYIASDGKIWVGTYFGGLDCFDGDKFTHYRHNPNNYNSPANNKVWSIAEDKEKNIWIGTLGNGLQSLNPQTGKFTSFPNQLTSNYISSICFGQDEKLYIGTAFGLAIYDKRTNQFTNLTGNKAETEEFTNQNVNQVYVDSRGLIWIATQRGVNILDPKKDKLEILIKDDGLVDNIACSIVEDSNKNMWITTSNGVSNIMVQSDSKTGDYTYSFYNYDEMDGLQNREFNMRSSYLTAAGEVILGGISGFNIFLPQSIKYNQTVPKVVFTNMTLFNKDVKIDSIYSGKKLLDKALNRTKSIRLKYSQNIFSISFSGMNFMLPEKNRYAYKLEGFNDDWLEVDGRTHQVSYTSLPPGTYTFMVKAANSDGYWSEDQTNLQIIVEPPFWRSIWAYIIYVILAIVAMIIARRLMLRSEREKFRLEQVKKEAQHKHEMDDMKLRFFTNISHEFRTPLSLIISPLERIIDNTPDDKQKQKLVLVKRNAIRLLNLVNQLLDFRKSDVSQHQLKNGMHDLIPSYNAICQSFMELTDKKNINFSFASSENSLRMLFDEDKMEKILMNLLSNAFKFTNEGGEIKVEVRKILLDNWKEPRVEIRVSDTGVGVSDEDKEHIFERFYQAQHKDRADLSGSGIGLHMVKEFVTLHGGEIHIEDNPIGSGSIFVITLPIITEDESIDQGDEAEEVNVIYATSTDIGKVAVDKENPNDECEIDKNSPLILIVDDNEDFRTFMRECLEEKYQLVEAVDGIDAWKKIPDLQPDIIISDVMMPNMDGNQLCMTVKGDLRTSHIPIILLTARTAEEQKIEGLETGADDYITKPFNLNILLLRIKKLLENQKNRQSTFTKQIEPEPSQIAITSLDEKLITQAIEYVENNIDRSELSVEELSRELGMSRVHLYKKLTAITGRSPVEFIRIIRLKRAAQMLKESQLNVSEIAYSVGFNNPKYFSRYFKDEFGMLPSDFKNQK